MLPDKGGFVDHHFPDWWTSAAEPMVSLGTDDVGVFGSLASEEHLLAAQHYGLSRTDLVRLSRCAMATALGDTSKVKMALDSFEETMH
jgi:adenosine deaminase